MSSAPPPFDPSQEHVYYQNSSVVITSARAIFGSSTYPIRNITSVRISKVSPSYTGPVVMILFGIALLLLAVSSQTKGVFFLALVFFALGALMFTRCKTIYQLTIGNAGTEFTGTTSYSREYIAGIHDALSASITNYR